MANWKTIEAEGRAGRSLIEKFCLHINEGFE